MKKFNRRFLSLALAFLFIITPFCLSVSAVSFPDVPDTHWAKDYIQELVDLKVIDGCPDGTYKPENKVLACEFIKMIVCAYSDGYRKSAESVSLPKGSHWARGYLEIGDELFFLSSDYKTDEALNREITRFEVAEMVVFMYIFRNYRDSEKNHTDLTGNFLKDITDTNLMDDYQKEIINTAIKFGLMTKFDDGKFKPNATLTRAEAAEIIYRAVKN